MSFVYVTPERWAVLLVSLGSEAHQGSFDRVLSHYGEAHRRYHNAYHIDRSLLHFEALKSFAERPELVEYALWLHDVAYDTHANDNELKSAALAEEMLALAGLHDLVGPVRSMIMATRHVEPCLADDVGLVVDIDLAVLASPPEDYEDYCRHIREEYHWVPEEEFLASRIHVLETMLAMPSLYAHKPCIALWEDSARTNIGMEVSALRCSLIHLHTTGSLEGSPHK